MIKRAVLKLNGGSLKCYNMASIKEELQCLAYSERVCYQNGYWHLIGKKDIATFVSRITERLTEIEQLLGENAAADVAADRAFLAAAKQIKAA
jgi:hypothetical protein